MTIDDRLLNTVKDKVRDLSGRQPLALFLIGSHATGLASRDSDLDFVVFVLPTWKDLALDTMYNKQTRLTDPDCDIVIKDVRLASSLLEKQNPHILNILETDTYWISMTKINSTASP